MPQGSKYLLKLARLNFISAVDDPAQQTAKVKLTKRKAQVSGAARVVKLSDDDLGLVFLWACTTTDETGAPYFDLHGDHIVEADLIKVAAEFMESGGATDEMHNENPDGRVVFAMPLTSEVAKAFGIETKTTGLMIGMKPSAEVFQKFKSGEYTGVSIDALGYRAKLAEAEKAAKAAGKVKKRAVVTSETDGHAHTIDLDDPSDCSWARDHLTTSYQTADGADNPHSHAWVFADDGTVTVVADSGHTHTVTAKVPADVLAAVAREDAAEAARRAAAPEPIDDDPSDGIPAPISDEKSSGATVVVIANKDGTRAKSTRSNDVRNVKSHSEEAMPTEQEKQIETLTKRNEFLERAFKMTGAQKSHYDSLTSEDDREAFLKKSSKERDAELVEIEKANEVVYTCDDGTVIRKSHGAMALKLAKSADEAMKIAKAQQAEAEHERLVKRAGDLLGNLAGSDGAHVDVLRAVESIADQGKRDAAIATLKAANTAMGAKAVIKGAGGFGNPTGGDQSPETVFDAEVKKYAEANKIADAGLALEKFLGTEAGRVAKRAYNVAKGIG